MKREKSGFTRSIRRLLNQAHKLVASAKKATGIPHCLIVWLPKLKRCLLVQEEDAEERVFMKLLKLQGLLQ